MKIIEEKWRTMLAITLLIFLFISISSYNIVNDINLISSSSKINAKILERGSSKAVYHIKYSFIIDETEYWNETSSWFYFGRNNGNNVIEIKYETNNPRNSFVSDMLLGHLIMHILFDSFLIFIFTICGIYFYTFLKKKRINHSENRKNNV